MKAPRHADISRSAIVQSGQTFEQETKLVKVIRSDDKSSRNQTCQSLSSKVCLRGEQTTKSHSYDKKMFVKSLCCDVSQGVWSEVNLSRHTGRLVLNHHKKM